jgi:single-strand DNA-binding protein
VEADPRLVGQAGDPLWPQHRRELAKHAWQAPGWHDRHTVHDDLVWRGYAGHLAGSWSPGQVRWRSWESPEGDKRSVTGLEADEVGASPKWATAKVERTSQRGNGERAQGRERQAERGGDFNDQPPF